MKTELPKYQHVVDTVRQEILSGRWQAGHKLATEIELASQFNTTKVTVGRAMSELVGQGLVERQRGKGTFVKQRRRYSAGLVFEGQIFDSMASRSLAALLRQLEVEFAEQGWSSQYFLGVHDDASAERLKYALDRGWFDGLIVSCQWFADEMLPTLNRHDPLYPGPRPAAVGVYPYESVDRWIIPCQSAYAQAGVEALHQRGCRRLAMICGPNDFPQQVDGAELGFRQALDRLGLPCHDPLIHVVRRHAHMGYRAFHALWESDLRPDGVVTDDEVIAQGIVRAMVELGVRTPQDVILAAQVADGTGHLFALPFVELRTLAEPRAKALVAMLHESISQPPDMIEKKNMVITEPTVFDPFQR